MCLQNRKAVSIDKKIGYVLAYKNGDEYIPAYYDRITYKMGERDEATTYDGTPISTIDLNSYSDTMYSGFYFFKTKKGARMSKFLDNRLSCEHVLLECLFENVFEKGTWVYATCYRARYRTILSEIPLHPTLTQRWKELWAKKPKFE